jgi:6-pyruvoyltetrahydropterin/6-carboxytetrahydropterin synthase
MPWTITREHEICCGHRVYGHEGKCKYLHGHNYKFELTVSAEQGLDSLGRVIDFNTIKELLCQWLEDNWDHKMLLWNKDPFCGLMIYTNYVGMFNSTTKEWLVALPCNPTVENLAAYFVEDIAPGLLIDTDAKLVSVKLWETSKCSTTYIAKDINETTIRNDRKGL